MEVMTRNAPGIAEAIRAESMKYTKRAMLSRGASVIRGQTLIVNLPARKQCGKVWRSYWRVYSTGLGFFGDPSRSVQDKCQKER